MANSEQEAGGGSIVEGASHFHDGLEVAELGGLEGGSTMAEIGAAGAGGMAAAGGAVALAGYGGYEIGQGIEAHTHIGSHAGDALYDASNPDDALAAANSSDDASQDWSQGHYLDAVGDGFAVAGHMVEGLWHGNSSSSSSSSASGSDDSGTEHTSDDDE